MFYYVNKPTAEKVDLTTLTLAYDCVFLDVISLFFIQNNVSKLSIQNGTFVPKAFSSTKQNKNLEQPKNTTNHSNLIYYFRVIWWKKYLISNVHIAYLVL